MKIFDKHSGHVSLDEIRKYKDNRMSNEERHLFERHLLSCEFCNEAFEGYQMADGKGISVSIKSLTESIDGRSEKKGYYRIAVAAAIVMLLGASVVFTMYQFDRQIGEVAMTERTEEEEDKMDHKDSANNEEKKVVLEDLVTEQIESKKNEPVVEQKETRELMPDAQRTKIATGKIQEKKSIPPKVEDEVAVQELSDEENDAFGASDESFDEGFGFSDVSEDEQTLSEPIEQEEGFNETAPLPVRVEKRAAFARKLSDKSKKHIDVASTDSHSGDVYGNALPIIGFERYSLYLRDSLRYPTKAKENHLEGIVKLQFRVSASGALEEIKIVEGLSDECNAEAKRLIMDGSKWTLVDKNLPVENNVVNLSIEFSLSE